MADEKIIDEKLTKNEESIIKKREAQKIYREVNRNMLNEKSKEYYNKNKEIINSKRRERYNQNKGTDNCKGLCPTVDSLKGKTEENI